MSFSFASIELTKSFDLVSRDGLLKVLSEIGCQHNLQSMIESFHSSMNGIRQFSGSSSQPFNIHSSVKQSCVLAECFLDLSLRCFWKMPSTQKQRDLPACPITDKTKEHEGQRHYAFADDAAIATYTQQELQALMNCFSQACEDFGLTINLKNMNIVGYDTDALPVITTDDN